MSGSTIGGLAGGAIGFWVGGPAGARWGFMIGSAVGGYLDPIEIEGPKLTDAQAQTSNEGVPRTIVYGTCCVAGNLIQWGPLEEHERTEDSGKGGPENTTYYYTRTVAIRICEAAPLGGTMRLRRVWQDDKLVYDASAPDPLAPFGPLGNLFITDSQKFAAIMTFYTGAEDQLPDPSLESLPEEYGGGVGETPAYPGTCYVVLKDLECPGGRVPQFRWEVASDAEVEPLPGPTIGFEIATATMSGELECAYIGYLSSGASYGVSTENLAVGGTINTGAYTDNLTPSVLNSYTNAGDMPSSIDKRLSMRAYKGGWGITGSGNVGICGLTFNGSVVADLRPTPAWGQAWWYAESWYYPGYGELIWFGSSKVYVGVRKVGTGGVVHNRIYRWPLEDVGGDVVGADATSEVVTAGNTFYVNMDRYGIMRAIALLEAELVTYDADLVEVSRISLPMSLTSLRSFTVDSDRLFLHFAGVVRIYDINTFTLLHSVTLTGGGSSVNNQIICTDSAIFVRSGLYLKSIQYAPSCYTSAPEGWYDMPDTPNAFTNGVDIMPRCGAVNTVTPGKVSLPAIITDIASRVGIRSDQLDLSTLAGKEVRGYPVARETTADAATLVLMQAFFFELPEWGNSGDTGTKLRSVLRGGASVLTLTEDDIVGDGSEDLTRPQQVEFPRKLTLAGADPNANYETASEPAERESENVKAVGEQRASTSVVMTRDELAVAASKMLKMAEADSAGRISRTVPKKFSTYTPSDCLQYADRRYRIEQATLRGETVEWDMVVDRASAATSTATGTNAQSPSQPTSSARGPTISAFMNLPSLRSSDNVPGMYIGVQGLLPGWIGADIYLSVDGGASEQKVASITTPATMGVLSADCTDSSEPIAVQLYNGGELVSITEEQAAARLNGFAMLTAGVAEVAQFQDADEVDDLQYELTTVDRGQLGTSAVGHFSGDTFVLLDAGVIFLPLDASLAGKTLIFRAVSIGTAPANNSTTSVVFDPPVFIRDGGVVTP